MSVALITGAGGQDGRLLSRRLTADRWRVVGLVRAAASPVEPGVERLVCDAGDGAALTMALTQVSPDRVFHLAAAHHPSEGKPDDEAALTRAMVRVNFDAAATILDWMAAKSPRARAVFAGSSQMYAAPAAADAAVDETTPMAPRTFYGRTKAWTRDLARHARERLGLHASFAVLFNHESELRGPGFLTRKIVDAAASGVGADILNAGARADWSAAEDIVAALGAMAEASVPGEYVLGSGEVHAARDWIDIAFARAGADPAILRIARETSDAALRADPSRAARELGWRARIGFRALVERMTDAAVRESRSRGTAR
ncbi:MAG: GDP-mannose 4,6-dehydratase [Tagaea sp.]|nr:GDP-mannose 4,6-dehydratase [Tagaea sp.]